MILTLRVCDVIRDLAAAFHSIRVCVIQTLKCNSVRCVLYIAVYVRTGLCDFESAFIVK